MKFPTKAMSSKLFFLKVSFLRKMQVEIFQKGSIRKMPSRRKAPEDVPETSETKKIGSIDPTILTNFTKKQAVAFRAMSEGKNIFLTGPAGGGKSYLIESFRKAFPHKKIAVTATTGIAAVSIGGTTLHSFLGLGITKINSKQLTDKVLKSAYLRDRWRKTEVLIIDEISMLSPDLFDVLEATARAVRCGPISLLKQPGDPFNYEKRTIHNQPVFGGIQLILTGDLCQLPPIQSDKFCFESATWDICVEETIYLDEIMRQKDPAFQKILNELRMGKVSSETRKVLRSREDVELKNDFGIKPTKVNMTNAEVDYVNEQELDILAEDGRDFFEYTMEIEFYGRVDNYSTAMEKIRKNCMAPQKLQLCEGAQVLLLKNLDMDSGLANGSRGVVVRFEESLPIVKFMNGEEREIRHGSWDFYEGERKWATAVQIPLKVAYAVSAHKIQGSTLDLAEVDLGTVFEYGQAYVGLSRIRDIKGLSIKNLTFSKIQAHPKSVEFYRKLLESESTDAEGPETEDGVKTEETQEKMSKLSMNETDPE